MNTILKNFTSRKFLLALSAFTAALANGDTMLAVSTVIAYLAAQGTVDTIAARK